MALKTTRWRPDTCDCVVEYQWDSDLPPDQRSNTGSAINRTCPAHEHISAPDLLYEELTRENTLKNRALVSAADYTPHPLRRLGWRYDHDRTLVLRLPNLDETARQALQDHLTERFSTPIKVEEGSASQDSSMGDLNSGSEFGDHPVIAGGSPLMRIPEDLDPKQRILLDSLRYAVNMVGLCYSRLLAGLGDVTAAPNEGTTFPSYTPLFVDAWSLVDACDRITPIVMSLFPGEPAPWLMAYKESMAEVRETRNSAHHLTKRIDRLVQGKKLPWGAISWVTVLSEEPLKGRVHVIGAGTMVGGMDIPFVNPAGRAVRGDVSLVYLYGPETVVGISETVDKVLRLVAGIEQVLAPQFVGKGGSIPDIYASVDFE